MFIGDESNLSAVGSIMFSYVSFFPQLVAGPIVRARDFIPQMYKNPTVTRSEFGEGLFLILCGLFKKTVISDYISMNFVDRIFRRSVALYGCGEFIGCLWVCATDLL